MKIIIAGSRNINNYNIIVNTIKKSNFDISEIVSGNARGVDKLGERFAKENNIKLKLFPANWDKYGKGAGYIRNIQMAEYADALIAIWDGISKGTKMMIELAKKKELKIFVCEYKNNKPSGEKL